MDKTPATPKATGTQTTFDKLNSVLKGYFDVLDEKQTKATTDVLLAIARLEARLMVIEKAMEARPATKRATKAPTDKPATTNVGSATAKGTSATPTTLEARMGSADQIPSNILSYFRRRMNESEQYREEIFARCGVDAINADNDVKNKPEGKKLTAQITVAWRIVKTIPDLHEKVRAEFDALKSNDAPAPSPTDTTVTTTTTTTSTAVPIAADIDAVLELEEL